MFEQVRKLFQLARGSVNKRSCVFYNIAFFVDHMKGEQLRFNPVGMKYCS